MRSFKRTLLVLLIISMSTHILAQSYKKGRSNTYKKSGGQSVSYKKYGSSSSRNYKFTPAKTSVKVRYNASNSRNNYGVSDQAERLRQKVTAVRHTYRKVRAGVDQFHNHLNTAHSALGNFKERYDGLNKKYGHHFGENIKKRLDQGSHYMGVAHQKMGHLSERIGHYKGRVDHYHNTAKSYYKKYESTITGFSKLAVERVNSVSKYLPSSLRETLNKKMSYMSEKYDRKVREFKHVLKEKDDRKTKDLINVLDSKN
jgi:uncharacterized coiled-coil DUF342 family protein